MFDIPNGVNGLDLESIDIDELFRDDDQQETPPAESKETTTPTADNGGEKTVDQTKAFAKRLKESTDKARTEEREAIAKQLGYASYEELAKSKEKQTITDSGLNPEEVEPLVEELVKQRLENDPRMKELEQYRKQRLQEFGKKELAEITRLSGGEITSFNQLSQEVIDAWKQKGSLKAAYLQVEGESRITKMMSEQSKGSTDHLSSLAGGSNESSTVRTLTDEEKRMMRYFNPHISDEELNKMTVNKNG